MKNIWDIAKELGLRKYVHSYAGTYATGDFELYDYGCGLLHMTIVTVPNGKAGWYILVVVSTIDDGVWQAEDVKNDYTKEEALSRVEEVAQMFLSKMGSSFKLPTEKTLNEWLMHVKLWGQFVG